MKLRLPLLLILGLILTACDQAPEETAAEFVARVEQEGNELNKELSAAFWVRNIYITQIRQYWRLKRVSAALSLKVEWLLRPNSTKILIWTHKQRARLS